MQYTLWERIILANERRRWDDQRDLEAKHYTRETQKELKEAAQKDPDGSLVKSSKEDQE